MMFFSLAALVVGVLWLDDCMALFPTRFYRIHLPTKTALRHHYVCSAPTTKRKVLFHHYVTGIPARWRVWQSHGWSQVWVAVGDPSAREFPTRCACQVISLRCHLHKLRFSACILVGCCNLLLATTVPRLCPLKLRCSLKHYNFLRLLSSDTLVAKCSSVSFRVVLPS